MRRSDREVKDIKETLDIVSECEVCRIAINDTPAPYIVPLNFGYTYDDNQLALYFHCAKEGKKLDLIDKCNIVSFEMDCKHQLVSGEHACSYGYAYASVIGNGVIKYVNDYESKVIALNQIMKQYTGKEFTFDEKAVNTVKVLKLVVKEFTAKARKLN